MQRGIIIPDSRWRVVGRTATGSNNSEFDRRLRHAVVYWDKIDVPNAFLTPTSEMDTLREEGILTQTPGFKPNNANGNVTIMPGQMPSLLRVAPFVAYEKLERSEPGIWSIESHDGRLNAPGEFAGGTRTLVLELRDALPVPGDNVALAKILKFRRKRADERAELMLALEDIRDRIIDRGNKEKELERLRLILLNLQRAHKSDLGTTLLTAFKIATAIGPTLVAQLTTNAALLDAGAPSAIRFAGNLSLGIAAYGGVLATWEAFSGPRVRFAERDAPFLYAYRVTQELK